MRPQPGWKIVFQRKVGMTMAEGAHHLVDEQRLDERWSVQPFAEQCRERGFACKWRACDKNDDGKSLAVESGD